MLALKPQRIDVLPGDTFERRDGVGANALMRLRMPGAEAKIAGVHHHGAFAAASLHRHHLGTTGDHEILEARHDSGGCHVDAGDAGSAEAVERHAAGTEVISGIESGHPAEIAALLAALGTGAPDNVVDIGGIDPGAIGQRPQHGSTELLRMNAGQRTFSDLANASRRSACIDDQRVNHGVFLMAIIASI